ncbi:MAG: aminotransferase class I/II-fold pyridoxal phosphate-dependent enzyme [Alphaproteobacteria bacterium]|nr:aminotransferase class I/II-fold pyridoxal phosphate-dependent enzyme [Alphaproteobacteria bacterium]
MSTRSSAIRPAILAMQQNGIGTVSSLGLGDPDIIPLWFGETDLVTPAFIREAAKRALDEGRTFYSGARGIRPLRQAVAEFYRRVLGVEVDVARISLPGAATLALVTALECVVETGDNVVMVSPVWPSIFQAVEVIGGESRFVRLDEDWSATPPCWRLDLQKLFDACDGRTKAIFVASPGNPTGWVMSRAEQEAVLAFARERGIAIISDEVYGTLVFGERQHAPSFLELATGDDDVFVVNGFSKAWAMTGWRIGWLVHPQKLDRQMDVICIANNTGPAAFAQYGALAALSPEGDAFRGQMLAYCRAGRKVVQEFLATQNRIRWIEPEGAFYGFLQIEGMTDSLTFASDLVRRARVGVSPGSAFAPPDDKASDSCIRICYAQNPERLKEGLARLAKALAER